MPTKTLKIKTIKDPVSGEIRVPPEVMRILIEFAEHKKVCDECHKVFEEKTGIYCATGFLLIRELVDQPEVEFV